ncbi:MAG: hypothetical protein AAFO91_08910 [Bacteroidota bacterium]
MNESTRPALLFFLKMAAVGLIFGLLSLGIWIAVNGEHLDYAAGQIIAVTNTELLISDRNEVRTRILISSTTRLFLGPLEDISAVTPGMFLISDGRLREPSVLEARSVRLIRPPRE